MDRKILSRQKLIGGTYNQTIEKITLLEDQKQSVIVRKQSALPNPGLAKEVEFLISLEAELKEHFPRVLNFNQNNAPIYYEMPFYQGLTLKEAISKGQISVELCLTIIKDILHFMFKKVFSKNLETTKDDYLMKTVFSRVKERYKELSKVSPIMRSFIESKVIVIEGRNYKNVLEILENIQKEKSIMGCLTPKRTHMIHGDFHFDNFIINPENPERFILIDPRGEKRGYSYDYDLGKLWFSFHGKYDLLTQNLFKLEYDLKESKIIIKKFKYTPSRAFKFLSQIYDHRQELLELCKKYLDEPRLEDQILFNEAIHFCALAPFQLKNDGIEKVAIGKYITGVKLLNDFMERLK